jgi:hypothetical protein
MNGEEWVVSTDPRAMLDSVRGKASERKLRLFAAACCRLRWAPLPDERSQAVLELAERQADGEARPEELGAARQRAYPVGVIWALRARASEAAAAWAHAWDAKGKERAAQAGLLREILGNPFRSVSLNPAWLNATVTTLAQALYDGRNFADLPILADALEESGCTSPDLLDHLRGPGPHALGCWALDLALNKS